MILKDICEVPFTLSHNQVIRHCSICSIIICILFSCFLSYYLAFLLFLTYCSGLVISYGLIKFRIHTSAHLDSLASFFKDHSSTRKKRATYSCNICNNESCKRHHQYNKQAPWQDVIISEELNQAVEQLFSRVLERYVSPWHKRLSNDDTFLHELEDVVKYSASAIIERMQEIDVTALLSNKLLPCVIKHINEFKYIEDIANLKNIPLSVVAVEHFGERLHRATINRNSELTYLRELTNTISPHILPRYLNCRNFSVLFQEVVSGWLLLPMMDVISDPNIINCLIIIAANYSSKPTNNKQFSKQVQFLKSFGHEKNLDKSLFYKTANEIRTDAELLYTFMQYLKSEDQVHLLEFYLDIAQFNDNFLSAQSSKKAFEDLCEKAIKIHTQYKSRHSANEPNCDEEALRGLIISEDEKYDISKLKYSSILTQVQKEVLEDLEENWLPSFFESNEFYNYLCGSKIKAGSSSKSTKNTGRRELTAAKTNKGKMKSELKDSIPTDVSLMPQEQQSNVQTGYSLFRDISTWEIAITSYISLNKIIYFHVNVKRPNPLNFEMETHRIVLRKDQDFHILKTKLLEFHGEKLLAHSDLPMRRIDSDIGSRMHGYEQFLKKLVLNSTLRGSDLLHTFLTTEEDFVMYISTCGTPVQDLENIYQTVAQKLRKEKGQHLDHFMDIYKTTTRNEGKYGSIDIVTEAVSLDKAQYTAPKTYNNRIFNNNFGVKLVKLKRTSYSAVTPENIIESLFYLGKHIFNASSVILKMYVTICSIARELVESIWYALLHKELLNGLSQQHLEYFVRCLEEVILDESTNPPTQLEQENNKRETLIILNSLSLKLPYKLVSRNFFQGLQKLWEISQYPHFNKQLTYQLLDIIMIELYPTMKQIRK